MSLAEDIAKSDGLVPPAWFGCRRHQAASIGIAPGNRWAFRRWPSTTYTSAG